MESLGDGLGQRVRACGAWQRGMYCDDGTPFCQTRKWRCPPSGGWLASLACERARGRGLRYCTAHRAPSGLRDRGRRDTCAVVIVLLYEDLYRELLVCGATGVLLVHLGLAKKTASTGGRESVFLRAAVKRAKSMERACSRGLASFLGRVHVIAWRSTRATSPWPCRLANWRASVLWARKTE